MLTSLARRETSRSPHKDGARKQGPLENGMIVKIREMILDGTLAPGARVTESALAERLQVSRTPVRSALPALAKEGLLTPVGRRGFAVRSFTLDESLEALALRSLLEGMAARRIAETGVSDALLAKLQDCLCEGDAIFAKGYFDVDDEEAYGRMNARFHALIMDAARSELLDDLYQRVTRLPFVAPGAIAFNRLDLPEAFRLLSYAHGQHHAIVEAMAAGDAARAEWLFREHAHPQRQVMGSPPEPVKAATRRHRPGKGD